MPQTKRDADDGDQSRRATGSPAAMTLAANLRTLRTGADLTLADLAARAKIGKSTLAQIESGKANPSIDTLFALTVALGVPLGHLFTVSEPEVRVVRDGHGIPLRSSDEVTQSELMATSRGQGTIEIFSMAMVRPAVRIAEPHMPGTIEHVLVSEGVLRTGPVDRAVELRRGDFATFGADVPHVYEALEEPTRWTAVLDYVS